MTTIGETISRVRNTIKGVREDAFLTDRYLYSVILKYAKLYIRRQDSENKIMRFQSLFETLPCVDLIDVDKIEACCGGIKSKCIIKRTKDRLPTIFEGVYGPLFRTIGSIDGSIECFKTYPNVYTNISNSTTFKYNNNAYYWYSDGYLYFPNILWESVRVEGLWDESISYLKCDGDVCKLRQDDPTHFPDYLFAEIEKAVFGDIMILAKMPNENSEDNQSILRS